MENIFIAVIGGSGLYSMPGLTNTREYNLDTPFGKPSAPVVVGTLEGKQIAFLAREAELCYAVMAHVTDYDVWHVSEAPVSVEMVIQTLNKNTQIAQEAIRNLVRYEMDERSCGCANALAGALITDPKVIPQKTKEKLALLVDKYL